MASPQIEDGRTEIANDLMDALCSVALNDSEHRILFVILRKTYGWHKKTDKISLTLFSKMTNIPRENVARTLRSLLRRNIIIKTRDNYITEYGVQKDYDLWLGKDSVILDSTQSRQPLVSIQTAPSVNLDSATSVNLDTHKSNKSNITKAILQKQDSKHTFGEYKNVKLTDTEYGKLIERFTEPIAKQKIEELSEGIELKGYKYKSHYIAILKWDRLDNANKQETTHTYGRLPSKYTPAPHDPELEEMVRKQNYEYRGNPSQKPAGAFDDLKFDEDDKGDSGYNAKPSKSTNNLNKSNWRFITGHDKQGNPLYEGDENKT